MFTHSVVTTVVFPKLQPHSQLTEDTLAREAPVRTPEGLLWTHFGFMRGSVKVKLLIIGGVAGSVVPCRWLLGELSTARGRLLDLEDMGGLSVSAPSAEPVNTCREDRVAAAGRVIARSEVVESYYHHQGWFIFSPCVPCSLPLSASLPLSPFLSYCLPTLLGVGWTTTPFFPSPSPSLFLSPFHLC